VLANSIFVTDFDYVTNLPPVPIQYPLYNIHVFCSAGIDKIAGWTFFVRVLKNQMIEKKIFKTDLLWQGLK